MLMMPPALATKSGAHSTPRAASSSATDSAASRVLAAPATTAAGARLPGYVARALRDHRHVARRRADVLGRDVVPAQRVDRLGEVEQHVAPAAASRRAAGQHDHALAAPEREAGDRRLVG